MLSTYYIKPNRHTSVSHSAWKNNESLSGMFFRFRLTSRTLILVAGVAAVLTASVREMNSVYTDMSVSGYFVQETGDLLVFYLHESGKWPENWEDIKRFTETHKSSMKYPPKVEELERYVRINFDFDPECVDLEAPWSDHEPPLCVVTSRSGRVVGQLRDGNEGIYRYLRGEFVVSYLNHNKRIARNMQVGLWTDAARGSKD